MSDDDSDNDLFGSDSGGESDDTAELIASSKKSSSPTKRSRLQKKSSTSTKKKASSSSNNNDDDDGDDDSDDEAKGLFDSDEESSLKKSKSTPGSASSSGGGGKTLSKRERMEALQAKKRAAITSSSTTEDRKRKKSKNSKSDGKKEGSTDKGYESEDSYNSAEYVRTREDDDFIDTQGEDEEMVREYYAEQHFEDERELEEMEVKETKKGKGGGSSSSSSKKRGPDQLSAADKKDKDNPISIVVERMKKKKKVTKRFEELKDSAVELIDKMEHAAREDDRAYRQKKPGFKKLQMLPEVLNVMIQREMMRPLLEADFLIVAKKWIEPLENGSLGNVTLRSQMIDGIAKMNGDFGIDNDDLKKSEFGKLVMTLYMHKKETPEMKRKLKALIEQWSRRIFRKSGDMKQLGSSQAHRRSEAGLVGIAKAQASMEANSSEMMQKSQSARGNDDKDLGSILSDGVKQARDLGRNRVRVPYSKGFQYTIRPENKSGDVTDKKTRVFNVNDQRESLHKRMLDKNKRTAKNARSANISIEGRPTK